MVNPRDVQFDIVAHDKTEKATRSAADNLDDLAHKADEVDDANQRLGSRAGRHLRKVSNAVRGVASHVDKLKRKTEDGTLAIRSMGSKTAGSLRKLSRAVDDATDEVEELNRAKLNKLRRELDDTDKKVGVLKRSTGGITAFFEKMERSAHASVRSVGHALSVTASKLRQVYEVAVIPAVIAAIGLLPEAATIAGAGIVAGLGGGLTALGIKFAAHNKYVKKTFTDLKTHVVKELEGLSKPFVPVLDAIGRRMSYTFDSFAPTLKKAFKKLAPVLDKLSLDVFRSLDKLKPVIEPVSESFKVLAESVGAGMPSLMEDVATAFTEISNALKDNPQAITDFVVGLGDLIKKSGQVIAWLIRVQNNIDASEGGFDSLGFAAEAVFGRIVVAAARMVANLLTTWGRIPGPFGEVFRKAAAAAQKHADFLQRGLDKINTRKAQADIRTAEARLRVLGAMKPTPKVTAEIADLKRKLAAARKYLDDLNGKTVTTYVITTVRTRVPGRTGPDEAVRISAGGVGFARTSPGGNYRTGGATQIAAPNVTTYVQLDGREIAAHVRTLISEATGRQNFRARSGRR